MLSQQVEDRTGDFWEDGGMVLLCVGLLLMPPPLPLGFLISFPLGHSVCPLADKDKKIMEAS